MRDGDDDLSIVRGAPIYTNIPPFIGIVLLPPLVFVGDRDPVFIAMPGAGLQALPPVLVFTLMLPLF